MILTLIQGKSSTQTDLLMHALRFAAKDLPVFPLAPRTRVPLRNSHGYKDATCDHKQIKRWWWKCKDYNIGVSLVNAGIFVLDVDRQQDGCATLEKLEAIHGKLPPTATILSPSGGHHHWFRLPSVELRGGANVCGVGLDILKYSTVAPPSYRNEDCHGRKVEGSYRWLHGSHRVIADPPSWLVKLAAVKPRSLAPAKPISGDIRGYALRALDAELRILASAHRGERNCTLNKCAFVLASLVKAGELYEDETISQLLAQAMKIGLDERRARNTIKYAFDAAKPREIRRS